MGTDEEWRLGAQDEAWKCKVKVENSRWNLRNSVLKIEAEPSLVESQLTEWTTATKVDQPRHETISVQRVSWSKLLQSVGS